MTVYALNGLGRIGKLMLKPLLERGANVAWINDAVGDPAMHAHLLEWDTVHGRWEAEFGHDAESVTVDGVRLPFVGTTEVSHLPLDGVDVVIDCTGVFKTEARLAPYFDAGVKKVVVSAPVKDADAANIVYGVNHDIYDAARHRIVTAASCTTNCLVDRPAKELRRARSALNSMIPTTTGSATAITLIYPELKGRLNGHAVRVPLLNSSITDCVFELERETTVEEVNGLFRAAAEGELSGILGYEERPLVSADYTNDTRSSIVDAPSTMVVNGTQLKVYAWYDNEMGYAHRLVDVAMMVGASL